MQSNFQGCVQDSRQIADYAQDIGAARAACCVRTLQSQRLLLLDAHNVHITILVTKAITIHNHSRVGDLLRIGGLILAPNVRH